MVSSSKLKADSPRLVASDERPLKPTQHFQAISPACNALWQEIQQLGLVENIAELSIRGYTVVPPERFAGLEFAGRLREAVLDVAERRRGQRPDPETGTTQNTDFGAPPLFYLLFEDQAFRDAAMHPVTTALVTYLLGRHAIISSCVGLMKGKGTENLVVHADETRTPDPFAAQSQVCNITIPLTDYSAEAGGTCFVPGSHHLARRPLPGESEEYLEPVTARAGSLLCWTGRTWHGALPRTLPGLRMALVMPFFRPHMLPQERYRENVSKEMLAEQPARFASILGMGIDHGWTEAGPIGYGPETQAMGLHIYD